MPSQQTFDNLRLIVSTERFTAYHGHGSSDDIYALTRYVWNIELCASFYPLLQNLEIGFRNGINIAFTNYFKDKLWLMNQQKVLAKYEQASIFKAQKELVKNKKTIFAGSLIAELNFGFWTGLLSTNYERIFWNKPQIYNDVFQSLPVKLRKRQDLADRFNDIRRFRNRIFHHERILHINLQKTHDTILDTIGLLNSNLLKKTKIIDRFPNVYSSTYFYKLKNELEFALR